MVGTQLHDPFALFLQHVGLRRDIRLPQDLLAHHQIVAPRREIGGNPRANPLPGMS
jgi:hypothetical protein